MYLRGQLLAETDKLDSLLLTKAVATMTPEPKYLATKKIQLGTPKPLFFAAKTGNKAPREEPTRMTKMEEILSPSRPSNSFPEHSSDMIAGRKGQ